MYSFLSIVPTFFSLFYPPSLCFSFPVSFFLVAYFAKILVSHPDKGGDAAVFRDVQTSFESIRQLYDSKKIGSFATSGIL